MSEFTREDAVAAIIAMDAPQEELATETPVVEVAETTSEAPPEDNTDSEAHIEPGDEGELETEEAETAEVEPVDAPNWWDADAKGKFAELAPELQAIVRAQEDKREAITQKAKQQASEAVKAAENKVRELDQFTAKLNDVVSRADEAFKSKWDGMTPQIWSALAEEDPETAFRLKLEYDAEQDALKSVRATQEQAAAETQKQFYAEQRTKLLELAPDLANSTEKLKSVATYIVESGIPPEAIGQASAQELNIVYKAMKYDQMMAKAQAAKASAPVAAKPAAQKSLAPATSRESPLPPQQRELQQAKNRLNQTGSRDDLAAMFKMGAFG